MEELGGSEYLKIIFNRIQGKPPVLNPKEELDTQNLVRKMIHEGLLASAHDCSEGGLAVALVESCVSGPEPIGAVVELESSMRHDALLFGESQSRVVISYAPSNRDRVVALAKEAQVPIKTIGQVGGSRFRVNVNDKESILQDVDDVADIWNNSLSRYGNRAS